MTKSGAELENQIQKVKQKYYTGHILCKEMRHLCKEMHYKNLLFYFEDCIEHYSLKLKGPFHVLEITIQKKTY